LICRGTQRHTINFTKLKRLIRQAEACGEVPVYVMEFEGTNERLWIVPEKYLKAEEVQ
jgi:hypothetical protein